LKTRMIAIVLACCSTMTAQIGNYSGPGVLSRGAGDIGTRAGQDVDLRLFGSVTAIYDNGILPYSVDGNGKLVEIGGVYGTEFSIGAYGVHNFHHAKLGLDYKGVYRHYSQQTFYDGTDQTLALGYTYQKSARLYFDTRQMAGTISQGTSLAGILPTISDAVVTPASVLFDNRMNYLQSTLDVNYLLSARTILTVGGDGYGVWRKATGLIGMQGYTLRGTIQHRVTQRTTVGVNYQHMHYDFPKAFGESDINSFAGSFSTQLGRSWTFGLGGGVYLAEVQGLQRVAVDPEIAALLGVSSTVQTFYQKSTFPQWSASINRRFRRANLSLQYANGASAGNGIYLTSRQSSATGSFSYTAARKWSFSVAAGYNRLQGIGQSLQPYSQYSGGAGFTYSINRPLQLIARYDRRHQEIINGSFLQNSYRATIGISFSPSDIPLAFH